MYKEKMSMKILIQTKVCAKDEVLSEERQQPGFLFSMAISGYIYSFYVVSFENIMNWYLYYNCSSNYNRVKFSVLYHV